MSEAYPGRNPDGEPNPSSYRRCVELMEEFVAARTVVRPLRIAAYPGRQSGYIGFARVGSVLIEDVTADVPGTPIMYDVQIFAQESIDRGSPSARLVKSLPALSSVEYIDFLVSERVRRTVVDEGQGLTTKEYLAPEELELLVQQLTTLGPVERPL